MSKFRIIFAFLAFTGLIFWSCSKDSPSAPSDPVIPEISLIDIDDSSVFTEGEIVTVSADVTFAGTISCVEFYLNNELENTITESPFEFLWNTSGSIGSHSIYAKAYCTEGYVGISDTINVTVEPEERFVLIPGGTFYMGDHSGEGGYWERPVHQVTVDAFYIGKYPVTQKEWTDYMPSATYTHGQGDNYPAYKVFWYHILRYCNLRSIAEGLTPAYTILGSTDPDDWGIPPYRTDPAWDAVICDWTADGYRLPTEAEWEFAARGGLDGKNFPDGDTISHGSEGDTSANYLSFWSDGEPYYSYDVSLTEGNHPGYPVSVSPVGSFPPNAYGVYDMAGNVMEWCWDWWDMYTEEDKINPRGPDGPADGSKRVLRGGNWYRNAFYSRVSFRYSSPFSSMVDHGFRLAKTP